MARALLRGAACLAGRCPSRDLASSAPLAPLTLDVGRAAGLSSRTVAFAFLFALVALTWASGAVDFRSVPVVGGWSSDALSEDAGDWRFDGDSISLSSGPDGAGLTSVLEGDAAERRTTVRATREWPLDPSDGNRRRALRVSGVVERLSPASFEVARSRQTLFTLVFLRGDEVLTYSAIERFSGQFARREFVRHVQPPAAADRMRLIWQVRSPGSWRLDEARLVEVVPNARYPAVVASLLVGWAALAGFAARALGRRVGVRRLGILTVVVAGTVVGVALGQGQVQSVLEPPLMALGAMLAPLDLSLPGAQTILKAGHALAFAALTALLLRSAGALALRVPEVLMLVLALAIASEALQRHRSGRSAQLADVAIDSVGVLVALLAWRVLRRLRRAGSAEPLGT